MRSMEAFTLRRSITESRSVSHRSNCSQGEIASPVALPFDIPCSTGPVREPGSLFLNIQQGIGRGWNTAHMQISRIAHAERRSYRFPLKQRLTRQRVPETGLAQNVSAKLASVNYDRS